MTFAMDGVHFQGWGQVRGSKEEILQRLIEASLKLVYSFKRILVENLGLEDG